MALNFSPRLARSGPNAHSVRMKPTKPSKRYLGDRPESTAPRCEHPGCTRPGIYRAPRDRMLRDYVWLCLDHVRDYNQSWDFYAGLTQSEIEQEICRDTVWQRPTWRLGDKAAAGKPFTPHIHDPFTVFETNAEGTTKNAPKPKAAPGSPEYAVGILGLDFPLTRQALKMRYHELVKKHHPDRHGGDKAAEERLKTINEAHTILLRYLNAGTRKRAV